MRAVEVQGRTPVIPGDRKCLRGDLGEQGTCDVFFKGQLGIYCLEKLRDESQRFFQFAKSCVYLRTSFLYKKGPTAYISARGICDPKRFRNK